MAHRVSRRIEKVKTMESAWHMMYDITVIKVVADTYSELISGLDEISDEHICWWSGHHSSSGKHGMPKRDKGKWVATLRTPFVNKRHDDGRTLDDELRGRLKEQCLEYNDFHVN